MISGYPQGVSQQSQGRSQIVSLQSPIGGWNTRDALDAMPPQDALVLDNWFPTVGRLVARQGYEDFAVEITNTADDVETLINLVSGNTEYFVACTNNKIIEINDPANITDRTSTLTITDDLWDWTVFADSASPTAPTVLAVNGTDAPWQYAGGANASAWSPSGPTAADLAWVHAFKNRVYAGEKNSRDFWYGALGDIPGTMTRFPLSGIRGAQGNILFMSTMTRDTGTGPDDFAVFVTDQGQAIVYAGTFPGGGAATWNLVGVYEIPRPIPSRRAHTQLFGDVVIATERDYVFLSEAIQSSGATVRNPSKLTGAMQDAADKYRSNRGWQMITHADGDAMLCNIPLSDVSVTARTWHQHVVNTTTKAATRYTGWDMNCLGIFGGELYGGGTGAVYKLNTNFTDDANGDEEPIQLRCQTAWLDLGSPAIKHVQAARPFYRSLGAITVPMAIGTAFIDPQVQTLVQIGNAVATTQWGDAPGNPNTLWGDDSSNPTTLWAGGPVTGTLAALRQWRVLGARGTDFCLSTAVDIADNRLEWISTDVKLSVAGAF